jgi:HK97 family phage prohead protease
MNRLFVPEFRTALTGEQENRMSGHASVFGAMALIGSHWEQIDKRAFGGALSRPDDVRFLLNHNPDNLLGRTSSGTLELNTDEGGLQVRSTLPDTTLGRDVRELVRRGDLTGMSFGFKPTNHHLGRAPDGRLLRTITELELYDVSLATYPAYKESNDVVLRTRDFATMAKATDRRSQIIRARSRFLTER